MWTARLITTFTVAGALGALFACSDSAKPLGTSDTFTNDTAGQDVYSPPVPQPMDSGTDGADAYGPAAVACASCSCDPTKNYCFTGPNSVSIDGGAYGDSAVVVNGGGDSGSDGAVKAAVPLGAFGEPDGAADAGPPPPPCPMVAEGSMGCIPLPATCASQPTCACLLTALQAHYPSCYLVCTPSPGFLEVYCGG